MDYELRKTILENERQKPLQTLLPLALESEAVRLDFMANRKVITEINSAVLSRKLLLTLRFGVYPLAFVEGRKPLRLPVGRQVRKTG